MRRLVSILSLGLILVGLEMATRGVSLIAARFMSGISAVIDGRAFHVSAAQFSIGLVLGLSGLVAIVVVQLLNRTEERASIVGSRCPSCGAQTHRVKRNRAQRVLSTLMGQRLARRKCDDCGWSGLSLDY